MCFGLDFNPESGATHPDDRIKSNKLLVKLEWFFERTYRKAKSTTTKSTWECDLTWREDNSPANSLVKWYWINKRSSEVSLIIC